MSSSESIVLLNRPNPAPLKLDQAIPVHFIGVGGIGMSALAKVLVEQGFKVSGSDQSENAYSLMLQDLGVKITIGQAAKNVPQGAVVVASSAIKSDNPEALAASALNLPVFHRSDLLREIVRLYEISIGLTGTHGKTTMTGMTGLVLMAGDLDPTIVAGGKIPQLGTNARTSKNNRFIVAELDESDGTVVQYQPAFSVIANLELDHPDHYGRDGLAMIRQTFETYLSALDTNHTVLFNMNCPETRVLYDRFADKVTALKIVMEPNASIQLDDSTFHVQNVQVHLEGGYQADVYQGLDQIGSIWLQVPGFHNLANALFAFVIGYRLGIPSDTIRRALENFSGMGRRFEQLGTVNGARIIDDYAHHPTEVKATLAAARQYNLGKGRVIALFQPHRYQRLQTLWDEFVEAFEDADEVIIVDVYSAGEAPIDGVNSAELGRAIAKNHPAAEYWPSADWNLVQARLKTLLTPDDLLLTMGAGDVTKLGRELVKQNAEPESAVQR